MIDTSIAIALGIAGIVATIIAGLGGAWIGAALSQRAAAQQHEQERHEREHEREQQRQERIRSVRTLINLEFDHNLTALRAFWHQYCPEFGGVKGVPEEQDFMRYRGLIDHELPVWEHLRWESLTTELAVALRADELKAVQDIHTWLDMLTHKREQLLPMLPTGLTTDYDKLRATTRAEDFSLTDAFIFPLVKRFVVAAGPLWLETSDLWRRLDNSQPLPETDDTHGSPPT